MKLISISQIDKVGIFFKAVIIFRMEEPNTNLMNERQAKDLEALNEMIEQIAVELT